MQTTRVINNMLHTALFCRAAVTLQHWCLPSLARWEKTRRSAQHVVCPDCVLSSLLYCVSFVHSIWVFLPSPCPILQVFREQHSYFSTVSWPRHKREQITYGPLMDHIWTKQQAHHRSPCCRDAREGASLKHPVPKGPTLRCPFFSGSFALWTLSSCIILHKVLFTCAHVT